MFNHCLFLLFLLIKISAIPGFAQEISPADSIHIEEMLAELDQLENRDLDSTILLSNQIYKQASDTNYEKGLWKTMLIQGYAYHRVGQKDTAYHILNQLLEECRIQKDRLFECKALIQLAFNYQDDYNFEQAVDYFIQAEKLLTKNDPISLEIRILTNLGVVHRKMKNYDTALNYYDQIEEDYLSELSPIERYNLHMNKGNVYAELRKYDKTEELFNQAYQDIQEIDNPDKLALITYNLGALYYRQKRYQEANEYVSKSLESAKKIGNQSRIEMCYRVLGTISMDKDNYDEAETYFLKALGISKEIEQTKAILGNYKNLYINSWNKGYDLHSADELNKALNYIDKYSKLKDSLYQVETAEKILELEKQYETEKKNNQITLLEQENQLKEDKIYIQQTQRNYLLVVIILVTGILSIFIYFYYYYRKVNRMLQLQGKRILNQRNKISDQNEQLQKSINTQNKLFSIIAHDLRSPLVSISNVSKLIGFYLKDKRYKELGEVAQMMDQKNDQVLDLTDNLLNWAKSQTAGLNPFYEKVSFHETLDDCFELYQPIAEAKQILLSHEEMDDFHLWVDRNMLKTVCRNLINNAIKFTPKGGSIDVTASVSDIRAQICIQDSGIGISSEKLSILFQIDRDKISQGTEGEKSSGLGLTVCKEFVEAMKGRIWAESKSDEGSRFCVELQVFDPAIHHSILKRSAQLQAQPTSN